MVLILERQMTRDYFAFLSWRTPKIYFFLWLRLRRDGTTTMLYSGVQYSTVQYTRVLWSTVQTWGRMRAGGCTSNVQRGLFWAEHPSHGCRHKQLFVQKWCQSRQFSVIKIGDTISLYKTTWSCVSSRTTRSAADCGPSHLSLAHPPAPEPETAAAGPASPAVSPAKAIMLTVAAITPVNGA